MLDKKRQDRFAKRWQRQSSCKEKPKGTLFVSALGALKALMPRRLTEIDQLCLRLAEEKRERRRARNLRWWSCDQGWRP
jgi:hypothetical protein